MQYIVDTVPMNALQITSAGCNLWEQYKASGVEPSWEQLSQCELWSEAYSWLQKDLSGLTEAERKADRAERARAISHVHRATVRLSIHKSKMFMWGPLFDIITLGYPEFLWVECAPQTGCSNEVTSFLRVNPMVTVIAMGNMEDVAALIATLDQSDTRREQSHTFFHFSLASDSAFGPNKPHHKDKTLLAFILTPYHRLNPYYSLVPTWDPYGAPSSWTAASTSSTSRPRTMTTTNTSSTSPADLAVPRTASPAVPP